MTDMKKESQLQQAHNDNLPNISAIENRIYTIRGMQVMLDKDLAELYQVETKRLNEQVKRNISRFPSDFMFQLNNEEFDVLKSQFATSSWGGTRKNPNVFTEQGVAMLSGLLNSETAIKANINIMRAFTAMRKLIINNAGIFQRLKHIELHQIETDKKLDEVFKKLETDNTKQVEGIYFDGQIFDAYTFISSIIRKATQRIILIDNYIDDTVLTLLSKRNPKVIATIYTAHITKQLQLDLDRYNSQYSKIEIYSFNKSHDRFLIIDNEVYHIGASLKDLGKKWFAFTLMQDIKPDLLMSHIGL